MGILVYSLWTLNYGNTRIFRILGNAGFISTTVVRPWKLPQDVTQPCKTTFLAATPSLMLKASRAAPARSWNAHQAVHEV